MLPEVSRPNADYLLERLINFNAAGEGSSLPPRQLGENRVPPPTHFSLISSTPDIGGTRVTVTWEEPSIPTSTNTSYNIYASGLIPGSTALAGPFTFKTSPGVLLLPCNAVANVTLYCQTQLASGFATKLSNCPTVGITLLPPILYATSADLRYPQYNQKGIGVATLSGGTVTVTSPIVTSTSRFLLSRQSLGSSPGHLAPGVITPYTSFTITSSSGADDGTVLWIVLNPVTT